MKRVAAVLVSIVAFAACGDGDERLSKQEFLDQANAIFCKGAAENQAENAKVLGDESKPPTDARILEFVDFIVEHDRRTFDAIADLRGPKDLDKAVDALTADSKAALDTFRARMQRDPQAIDKIEADVFGPLQQRASKLGLGECG